MKKLTVHLEHCYGIKSLQTEFDFGKNGDVFAIYAPNGVMKTSFANTFRDLSLGKDSSDRVWPDRKTKRLIIDEANLPVDENKVFVIEPYNDNYRSDRIPLLLANEGLKKKYEVAHALVDEKTDALIKELVPQCGLKKGISDQISRDIMLEPNEFYRALNRVKDEVESCSESGIETVIYNDIFNEKVQQVLTDPNFQSSVNDYIRNLDELLGRSTFFRKGVFTHNNAADVAKTLSDNGFFKANHSVYLRIDGEKREVTSIAELEAAIETEKERILTDKKLKAAFEKMDKAIIKNADLRRFRDCLEKHPAVIAELSNPARLRQKLWIAYLSRSREQFFELIGTYNTAQKEIEDIVESAKAEQTRWAEVIYIFNERFSVPFVVSMENQVDVILKNEAPTLAFLFVDDDDMSASSAVSEGDLKAVLSNGEKRALYILNIIFEVEARRAAGEEVLFIVDDIADSFDYKNKYAIIEYLLEMSEENLFQQIILSHNFDFYRTICKRLHLKRACKLVASKGQGAVLIAEEHYQNAPFDHWRQNLSNPKMLIAAIPLMRNLAEYAGDTGSFGELTSLLHIKSNTFNLTVADLEKRISVVLSGAKAPSFQNPSQRVVDLIYSTADDILKSTGSQCELEEKIVLSIATRLKAEEFMIGKINDLAFVSGIGSFQTIGLIKRFKIDFPSARNEIKLLDQVNLMTPENLHLNSFMYEPILDLSGHHLKQLYQKVSTLS